MVIQPKRQPYGAWVLAISVLTFSATDALAQPTLGDVFDFFKKAAAQASAARVETETGPSTSNSRFQVNRTLRRDIRFALFRVTKSGSAEPEQKYVVPVHDGSLSTVVYFRNGAGDYLVEIFVSDAPEAYGPSYTFEKRFTVVNRDTRDLSYLLPSEKTQSDAAEIQALAVEITRGLSTETEKAAAIHDWIARQIAYDIDSFIDQTYNDKPDDALTVLKTRQGVCAGYANLYAALARAAGLRAKVIQGAVVWASMGFSWDENNRNQITHAWNEVFADGRWLVLDATWDAGYVSLDSRRFIRDPRRTYFDPSADQFARDHLKILESVESGY